ncbi:MAG TPA: hypothetical protein VFD64_10420 [Gemmatimonadaceae bacterium]|nr:hypothetical protein [Gemmatimonadaceae bacterium]
MERSISSWNGEDSDQRNRQWNHKRLALQRAILRVAQRGGLAIAARDFLMLSDTIDVTVVAADEARAT